MKTSALLAALLLVASVPVSADERGDKFRTRLSGYNEVHFIGGAAPALRGAVSTPARGTFEARIDDRTIHYVLTYEGLTGDVTQAHIHFGQEHTVGGIVVWLCQTTGTPAPAAVADVTPFCSSEGDPRRGTVRGVITPAQVLDVVGQGIVAGEFDELVAAIRAGRTYANVHSATFGPGEVRGQLEHDHRRD